MTTDYCIHDRLYAICAACTPDPLRHPETDEEPWAVADEPIYRDWSRIASIVCVVAMVAIALLAGRAVR